MRTISADNDAILTGGARAIAHRIQVKDAGGTFRDLTTYPGVDLVEELSWSEELDNPGVVWEATLTREQSSISLAPFMQASPLNRGFDPAASYAALLQVGRMMKVEYSMQAEDDPRARSWVLAFQGYIDGIDSGAGDSVKLHGRGLEAAISNAFIKRERVYAFAQGANATKGCYIWAPSTVWVSGDRVIPTNSLLNGHYYRVTTAGTGGTTEPVWPTGGGSTVADGSATFTESGSTSTSTGTAVETVMQQILNDNGLSGVTLACPVSPAWNVRWFLVSRQPTLDELRALADQIGWCLRYMDNAGTPELRLFDPNRTTTTSLRSFGPTEVGEYKKLATDWMGIRNQIRVVYSDSQDLDAAGNPKRKYVDRTDTASVTKYGELFAEIAEASGSNIDTLTEATTLADNVLSDLAEPTADMAATLEYFFPFVEVCDLYTLSSDGVHFDSDQKFAITSFQHHVTSGEQCTTINLRGKPASNGAAGWFQRMSDAVGADLHLLTAMENVAAFNVTADTKPVGGTRIEFDWQGAKSPKDAQFELHLSTTTGFIPDSTTLVQTGKDRAFEVGNLDPAKLHYAKVVPIIWNASKPVRGSPSAQISFTPGRGASTHLNPNVAWGRLPLNGGFETQFDPAAPPDFWTTNDWGTLITLGTTSGGLEGANYVKLVTTGILDQPQLTSAEFSVNEKKRYAMSMWRKCVSGSTSALTYGINWFDVDHVYISTDIETISLVDSVGTWKESLTDKFLPPSGARFAQVTVYISDGASGREAHVDSLTFDTEGRWHNVGDVGAGEPAFANTWANFGGVYAPARYKLDKDGWVVVEGLVKSGTVGSTVFTLPTGYRPESNCNIYSPQVNNNALGVVEFQSGGAVIHQSGGSNVHLSLQARFKAAV